MELKIARKELLDALYWTQNVVSRKSTMPILANALLSAKKNSISMLATDLEVSVSVDRPADVIKEGKITLPGKQLYDIVKELPEDTIHITRIDNDWIKLKCHQSEFKVAGLNADEFPQFPKESNANVFNLDASMMVEMLNKTLFAVSTDEARFNLNGIYLEAEAIKGGSLLKCVATDGHRLSLITRESKTAVTTKKGIIIPRKGVMEMRRLLEGGEGTFTLTIGEKLVGIEKGPVALSIRLIDGQFPPYDRVVPKDNTRTAQVSREELVSALKRVSLVASETSRGVKFRLSPGHLELTSNSPDSGEGREELPITYKDSTFDIGFNARYVLDVLSTLTDETVVLAFKNEVSPCLIRSESDKGFLAVVMPMRI